MVVDSWIGSNVLDRVVLVLAHSHAVLLESTQCLLIKLKGINFAYSELCLWLHLTRTFEEIHWEAGISYAVTGNMSCVLPLLIFYLA